MPTGSIDRLTFWARDYCVPRGVVLLISAPFKSFEHRVLPEHSRKLHARATRGGQTQLKLKSTVDEINTRPHELHAYISCALHALYWLIMLSHGCTAPHIEDWLRGSIDSVEMASRRSRSSRVSASDVARTLSYDDDSRKGKRN